jgi:hypothetical protein
MTLKLDSQARRNLSLYARGEFIIARGKFQQLRQQAKESQMRKSIDSVFQNSEKQNLPVNTTQTFADELQTSTDTASRIIQIQAKAKAASVTNSRL